MEITSLIVNRVKAKKELSGISDSVILSSLGAFLTKHRISLANINEKGIKLIVKEIRAEMRNMVGRFNGSGVSSDLFHTSTHKEILEKHSSTNERMGEYNWLNSLIAQLKIKSILDLGCGLNPIALAKKGIVYHASDIDQSNLDIVSRFFKTNKIIGDAFVLDLRKAISSDFPKADMCLLLKVVDLLDKKGHKRTEELLKIIPCAYFIISFPTKTLSGKPMNHPQRGWIERLLRRLGFKFSVFVKPNEIFYLASK